MYICITLGKNIYLILFQVANIIKKKKEIYNV